MQRNQESYKALRPIFDSPVGLGARLLIGSSQARRQVRHTARLASSQSARVLDLRRMEFDDSSRRVLFILGSGESVEELDERHFELIRKHSSVGLNAWPLHPFVPDFLAFEPFDEESTDYVQLFTSVLHQDRFREKRPSILLFRPSSELDAERYSLIPDYLRQRSYYYSRFVPVTRSLRTLKTEIRALHGLQALGLLGHGVVMDLGASILRMLSLAWIQGFHSVVLVGVDLNGGRYFWEANPAHLARNDLVRFSPGFVRKTHETMERGCKGFTVSEVLGEFAQAFRERGKSVFVGSGSSMLADFLPVFDWDSSLRI